MPEISSQSELLMKAASLCREASRRLQEDSTPQKEANEIVNTMVSKGLLGETDKAKYASYFEANPESMSSVSSTISQLPSRTNAIAELADYDYTKTASASDAASASLDRFIFG